LTCPFLGRRKEETVGKNAEVTEKGSIKTSYVNVYKYIAKYEILVTIK
jgi:hypothetical protein